MFRRHFRRPGPGRRWEPEDEGFEFQVGPDWPEGGFRHPHHPHHERPEWHERHERPERPERPERHGFGGWPRPPMWFAPEDRPPFGPPFGHGGPFGGGPFGGDGGGRQRQRRGDIKYVLLELLAEQPRHGYELIKELEQRYGGFYRPSPGSVYPTLQLLEEAGHLTSEAVDGKRVYTVTESGRQLLAERQPQAEDGPAGPGRRGFRGPGPELKELRRSGTALIAGLMEVARHGTPEQVRTVMGKLDTMRREIYAILAEEDAEDAE